MKATTSFVGTGLCLGVLGVSLFAGQQDTPAQSNRAIRVDVDLVLANVTVTDSRNRFVEGLKKEHFRIFEDKVEQEILTSHEQSL